jgi:hypothetical protein
MRPPNAVSAARSPAERADVAPRPDRSRAHDSRIRLAPKSEAVCGVPAGADRLRPPTVPKRDIRERSSPTLRRRRIAAGLSPEGRHDSKEAAGLSSAWAGSFDRSKAAWVPALQRPGDDAHWNRQRPVRFQSVAHEAQVRWLASRSAPRCTGCAWPPEGPAAGGAAESREADRCTGVRRSRAVRSARAAAKLHLPRVTAVPVHDPVAQPLARGEAVVDVAEQSSIASSRLATVHAHVDVIELDADPGAADPTRVDGPLAATAVALPDLALHGCWEVNGAGRGLAFRGRRAGLRDEPLPLGIALEEEVEPGGEDVLGRRAGQGVGEREASGLELVEEGRGDGDVEPGDGGGERLDLKLWRRRGRERRRGWSGGSPRTFGALEFARRCARPSLEKEDVM